MLRDANVPGTRAVLPASRLYTRCDSALFNFEATAELSGTDVVVGQSRALKALDFGVRVGNHGYNLFVLGRSGSQRHRIVEEFL